MQQIFTFTAKIDPARIEDLRAYLHSVEEAAGNHADLPFGKLPRLHYASLVIAEDPRGDYDPYLIFENNIDGTIDAHIEQLCDVASAGLHTIYSMCQGYPVTPYDRGRMRAYLRGHVLLPNASFVGNVGRTVKVIKADRELIDGIEKQVDELVAQPWISPPGLVYETVRAQVSASQSWALQPRVRLRRAELFRRQCAFAAIAGLAYLLWPLTLTLLGLFTIVLRVHECTDRSQIERLTPKEILAASAREDRRLQNHFASLSVVKAGIFRRTTLRAVLFLIDRAAALSVKGTLSRLDNIHFAHWVLLDGGRRLLFLTNYDGSWENYLDDFIDKAAAGLTAIWSNVENFPTTSFLVRGGARDERNFKAVARKSQLYTNVWYSAYPNLAVPSIDNNSAVRDGLATPPRAAQAVHAWVQRL